MVQIQDRDKEILRRLREPKTAQSLLDLFPSYQRLMLRLSQLEEAGYVAYLGKTANGHATGAPLNLYSIPEASPGSNSATNRLSSSGSQA